MNLSRFGVSIEENLLADFDRLIERKGYANRSEAIRALIRNLLLDTQVEEDPQAEVIGTLTLVYDHHAGDLLPPDRAAAPLPPRRGLHPARALRRAQLPGGPGGARPQSEVRQISDSLIGTRGVHHGRLIIGSGVGPRPGRGYGPTGTAGLDSGPAPE